MRRGATREKGLVGVRGLCHARRDREVCGPCAVLRPPWALRLRPEAQTVWREYERLWSEEQWVNRRSYAHLASVTGVSLCQAGIV